VDDQEIGGGGRFFSVTHSIQIGSGTYATSSELARVYFFRGEELGA
jgi:hypothetical protein